MYLQTDEQTISDLGIFGKRNGNGIYDIYNHTHTRGGEVVLKELFLQPLSNRDEINRRSSIIEHFAKLQMAFPFSGALFDMVEKYLANAETPGKNTTQQQVPGEKEIQQGVTALIELLQLIKQFVSAKEVINIAAYQNDRQTALAILDDTVFEPVFREKSKGKLSYTAVAAYDALFRLREYPKIKTLLDHIYYLDVYLSVAKLAGDRGFVFPKAFEKGASSLKLEGVYHPELEKPIGNNVEMNAGSNVIFLTGANMAGKSTFLRSISTALYVAHIGFPVAAKAMEFAVMDGIYTTINLPDNLGMGASHFYSEVLRVKKMAIELSKGKSLFVVFDELFRGTNVKDAHEATVEVTQSFAKRSDSLFIISSHIVEAGEDLKQQPTIDFKYLPTKMNGHIPEYTYKLESGITDDRHGMIIIRNEGILETLESGQKENPAAVKKTETTGFNIDKQTIEELNLLGKFRQGSVYGLFNKVKTSGGEKMLNEMFNQPLEESSEINTRSSIFRFFEEIQPAFPFDVQQIGLMRDYLDTNSGKNTLSTLAVILKNKWLAALIRDERYKKIIQGLQATVVTLSRCNDFLIGIQDIPGPYSDRIKRILTILSDKRLEKLRGMDIYQELPVKKLAFFDHLLKSSLRNEMQEIIRFIYELDLNIAISTVSKDHGFTYANALPPEMNVLSAKGLSHPCLNGAVGNVIDLDQKNNLLFLTGANMAGKSTLMKSVGIGLYLAHMGFPIAAEYMEFSVRDGLYSSINVADNIDLGYSHFYAEVIRVKQAAEAAASGKRLLLMFDELFKGTNVKDAYDGTLAVTQAFAAYDQCLFIVSTHIIEVGEALKPNRNIQFVYMPTIMKGVTPTYTYKLQKGITEDRQGMMIIRNEGILEMLENTTALN